MPPAPDPRSSSRASGSPAPASAPGARAALPEKAADTTAETPWPVRVLSLKIRDYVDKMSAMWVEGQVVQLQRRGNTAYLTLRDPEVDMSLSATISVNALNAMGSPLLEGARVVLQAKPTFWERRGTLQLDGRQIRPVGVGDLLARLEILKARLAAEGLFDRDRKRRLPFLPRRVGLITGRDSAAERDVVENARRRWPAVQFEIREVAVQGTSAVAEVTAALVELDRLAGVDVIVIARGGGAVEELLPFSNETLLRAVAAAATPVVSAIGHDVDTPLLDFVADVRASTPTDAAKLVVPDAAAERDRVAALHGRARLAVRHRLDVERRLLVAHRTRAVMTDPLALLTPHRSQLAALRGRATDRLVSRLEREGDRISHLRAQVRALSPQSTLDRGYAVVTHPDGRVVRDREDVAPDELLRVLVARGDFGVRVIGHESPPKHAAPS
ncbi:MAG: exodeoxyribonuclease VII large subunit [Actinomycetales bacterium]|uniref:Exodeoxyribonuclease 7 large subunit n=1 Tax=Candidatus Phosphoribacter hodrii TaxID=2953743 RepID=A0A9D7XXL8_9MICO|nr:exodeoxyribonuclease VII large subunit [Candidatus Phosphoribacter hodrii]